MSTTVPPGFTTWWVPLTPVTSIYAANARLNDVLRKRSRILGEQLIDAPVLTQWEPADFLDQGHLTPKGNAKLAAVLHTALVGASAISEPMATVLQSENEAATLPRPRVISTAGSRTQ